MVDNIFPFVVGNKQTQGIYCSPRSLFFISLKIIALIIRTTLSLVNTTLQNVDWNISILQLIFLRYKVCNFFSTIRHFLFAKIQHQMHHQKWVFAWFYIALLTLESRGNNVTVANEHILCLLWYVWLEFYVPLENFSLISRDHNYPCRALNVDQYTALIGNEQWKFYRVPHLLWHGTSVYNEHFRWPMTMVPVVIDAFKSLLRAHALWHGWHLYYATFQGQGTSNNLIIIKSLPLYARS